MTPINFMPALPELALLAAACAILLIDLFLTDARRHVSYWLTQLSLLLLAWLTLALFHGQRVPAEHAFGNMFVADTLSDLLKLVTYATVSLVLFYSRDYLTLRGLFRGETFVLMLFSMLGMMVMISANHMLLLYLGLELMSLSLYALVAIHRDSPTSVEAAMKYFVLGALGSGLMLYGMSMIYGATGALDLNRIAQSMMTAQANNTIMIFGLVFVVSGIAFKLGAVPYHMWIPDVYEGAPTPVTLFVGTASKIAAFGFMMRLLTTGLPAVAFEWQGMLLILSILSMILGNLVAIAQSNIKRMLAYSAIANMGYMLLGFLGRDADGFSAAMFYIVAYVLTTLAGFGMVLLLSREGFEAERIDDLKGLNQRSPWYAFMMLLTMFSLAGIPPTVGFYAKFVVIQTVVDAGLIWLAVIAVLTSVIGAFYYLRIVKLMYFDDPVDHAPIEARGDNRVLLSINGLALLLFGILPQPLMGLSVIALWSS